MNEKNLRQQLILIGVVVLFALIALIRWSPETGLRLNLKPGLDIAGGVAMIFEVDDRGLEQSGFAGDNLAETMKTLLQKRVDPQGLYNLVWRVHGKKRIEIQMPLPPKEAQQQREDYRKAEDELFAMNLRRGQIEGSFQLSGAEREAAIARLASLGTDGADASAKKVAEERAVFLREAAAAYDALQAARQQVEAQRAAQAASQPADPAAATQPSEALRTARIAQRDASETYNSALEKILTTNLESRRFQDVLDLDAASDARKNSLKELREKHPHLAGRIDNVIAKHVIWQKNRGFLDGPADLQRLLKGAGVLEFRILAEPSPENAARYDRLRKKLAEVGAEAAREGESEGWYKIDNALQFFNLDSPSELAKYDYKNNNLFVIDKVGEDFYVLSKIDKEHGLTRTADRKWSLKRSIADRDEHGRLAVHFELDAAGGDMFGRLTEQNIGKQLCIFVDDLAYSSANIRSKISTSGQISGDFSRDKVDYLVQTMMAGALPARLKDTPVSERTIGSSLGEENLSKAMRSGLLGAALVVVLMIVYYRGLGLIAVIAVAFNVLLTLAMLAMLDARITLDALAGLILSMGMCVDANILINERMREELQRGASLRLAMKNGFDRAWTAILDGNLTTLLTAVIIYYVGSQEIRGFGLTLGWGIALNLFTAVFAARVLLASGVRFGLIRSFSMMQLIQTPTIDWYSKRRLFIPLSIAITVVGLVLMGIRSSHTYLDVEFLGGTSATIELKKAGQLNDIEIANKLKAVGKQISDESANLREAAVEERAGAPGEFVVRVPQLDSIRIAAMLTEPLEEAGFMVRGGVTPGAERDSVNVRVQEGITLDKLREFVRGQAGVVIQAGRNISDANVSSVLEGGSTLEKGRLWEIVTTETNKALVQHAMVLAIGGDLEVQQRILFTPKAGADKPLPILDRRAEAVLPPGLLPPGTVVDLTDYLGGAALYFEELNPPQTAAGLKSRLRNMRLQPGHQDMPWRSFDVFGVKPAGKDGEETTYSSVIVAVVDPAFSYVEKPDRWQAEFAAKEQELVVATFNTEQALRKVSQFKPQIASQAQLWAITAVSLSWIMIVLYVWIRFGRAMYGIAGVAGLIHTVLLALAFVGFAGLIGGAGHPLGSALLVENFKINMTIIAALLTLIGYAINDTIVVFDRVRELRGRLGIVTPQTINDAVNQCMSRTILTGICVLGVLLIMYVFGGSSIRGFNYCMFIGVVAGTYSSVLIASPLLLLRADRPDERPRQAAPRTPS